MSKLKMYGWQVGDYAALKFDLKDENNNLHPKGTVVRIRAIAPKVTKPKPAFMVEDDKDYFYNAVPVGHKDYPRLRHDFCTIRKPTKQELVTALQTAEAMVMTGKLVV